MFIFDLICLLLGNFDNSNNPGNSAGDNDFIPYAYWNRPVPFDKICDSDM